jgi:hypothetical protein
LEKLALHLAAEADFAPFKGSPLEALAMISTRKGLGTALAIMSSSPIPIAALHVQKSAKISMERAKISERMLSRTKSASNFFLPVSTALTPFDT